MIVIFAHLKMNFRTFVDIFFTSFAINYMLFFYFSMQEFLFRENFSLSSILGFKILSNFQD